MRKCLVFVSFILYSFVLFFVLFTFGLTKVEAEETTLWPHHIVTDSKEWIYDASSYYEPSATTTFINVPLGNLKGVLTLNLTVQYKVQTKPWFISGSLSASNIKYVLMFKSSTTEGNAYFPNVSCYSNGHTSDWVNYICTGSLSYTASVAESMVLQLQNPEGLFGYYDGYEYSTIRIITDFKFDGEELPDPEPSEKPDYSEIIDNANKNHEETKKQLEEANNTSKSILQTILDFPKKIVDMIIEALKTLFIPSDDFWQNNFDKIETLITKKLGVLGYPFVLVNNTLNFFLSIDDSGKYIIEWPDIKVPNFDFYIIQAGSYDLGSVLEDSNIKYAHDLYMLCLNALILLSFVKLCHNKYVDVFGGQYDDDEYIIVEDSVTDVVDTDRGKRYFTRREKRRVKKDDE